MAIARCGIGCRAGARSFGDIDNTALGLSCPILLCIITNGAVSSMSDSVIAEFYTLIGTHKTGCATAQPKLRLLGSAQALESSARARYFRGLSVLADSSPLSSGRSACRLETEKQLQAGLECCLGWHVRNFFQIFNNEAQI